MGLEEREWLQEMAMKSLEDVGPIKPVGYLPLETLVHECGQDLDEYIEKCKTKGLETRIMKGHLWPGFHGSLYVYHREALQKLLNENIQILIDAKWPTHADEFVANLYVQEPIGTPLYKLIAKAFNDEFAENLEP